MSNKAARKLYKKKPNFFIEAGTADGELFSTTLYLELKYKWSGLLVEPNPMYLKALKGKKRNAWIFPYCLSPFKYPTVVDFDAVGLNGGIINHKDGAKKIPANIIMNRTSAWAPPYRKTIKVSAHKMYFQLCVFILSKFLKMIGF